MLSGCGANDSTPALSEVWKVQYDNYVQIPKAGSAKVLPVLMCSEDGILALLEQGNLCSFTSIGIFANLMILTARPETVQTTRKGWEG